MITRKFIFVGVVAVLATILPEIANALPRFALLSGTRCSACHFNPQGSGLRTELGYQTMNEIGAMNPEGYKSLYPEFSNSYLDGLITAGHDVRLQNVRTGAPGFEKRLTIPMQIAPYLAIQPMEELTLYGSYNVGGAAYRARKGHSTFPGQTDYDVALSFQPWATGPSVRAGMIQPSIGIRYDDHTVFVRREVAESGAPLIPPYYNEIGAEFTYEGLHWLTLNAGIFNATNMAMADRSLGAVESQFDFAKPLLSGRVMFWPQLLEQGLNGELGASILQRGSFRIMNVFGGIGLADKATISFELMNGVNEQDRTVRNASVMGSYLLYQWLSMHWRYDWAQTERTDALLNHANAFTAGFEFFPLPFVEIRPEYRLFQRTSATDPGTLQGQYTVQLHLFY